MGCRTVGCGPGRAKPSRPRSLPHSRGAAASRRFAAGHVVRRAHHARGEVLRLCGRPFGHAARGGRARARARVRLACDGACSVCLLFLLTWWGLHPSIAAVTACVGCWQATCPPPRVTLLARTPSVPERLPVSPPCFSADDADSEGPLAAASAGPLPASMGASARADRSSALTPPAHPKQRSPEAAAPSEPAPRTVGDAGMAAERALLIGAAVAFAAAVLLFCADRGPLRRAAA